MSPTNPHNGWRAALSGETCATRNAARCVYPAIDGIGPRALRSAVLCGVVATLIAIEFPANLKAQAPVAPRADVARGAVPGEALFTQAQAVAGKAAYERNCANCHGARVDDGDSA